MTQLQSTCWLLESRGVAQDSREKKSSPLLAGNQENNPWAQWEKEKQNRQTGRERPFTFCTDEKRDEQLPGRRKTATEGSYRDKKMTGQRKENKSTEST